MQVASHRLEVVGTLGQGGFGVVLLADMHGRDNFVQRVAVKVLHGDRNFPPDIVARLRDEARLLALLRHPNIVRVFDLGELNGRPAVIMEYVEGVDAGQLAKDHPLAPRTATDICASVAAALHGAWNDLHPRKNEPMRTIHRDIKPANVLVGVHGEVKVLDFGIARAEFDREGETGDMRFGTAPFVPPESWMGDPPGPAQDIFALGVTLARLATVIDHARWPASPHHFATDWKDWIGRLDDALRPHGNAGRRLVNQIAGMTRYDPKRRPNATSVARELRTLAPLLPGPDMLELARTQVAPRVERRRRQLSVERAVQPEGAAAHLSTMDLTVPPSSPLDAPLGADDLDGRVSARTPQPGDAPPPGERRHRPPRPDRSVMVGAGLATAITVLGGGALALTAMVALRSPQPSAEPTTGLVIEQSVAPPSNQGAARSLTSDSVKYKHRPSGDPAPPVVESATSASHPAKADSPAESSEKAATSTVGRQLTATSSGKGQVATAIPTATPEPPAVTESVVEPRDATAATTDNVTVSFRCDSPAIVTFDGKGIGSTPTSVTVEPKAYTATMRTTIDDQTYTSSQPLVITPGAARTYHCSLVGETLRIVRD